MICSAIFNIFPQINRVVMYRLQQQQQQQQITKYYSAKYSTVYHKQHISIRTAYLPRRIAGI